NTQTWYATPSTDGPVLSAAGIWYGYVSLPIFQFLLCRWYFRVFIWARFLYRTSRLDLRLLPTHPDRLGGLGFLANTVYAFAPLSAAHGALLAGPFANRIFYMGTTVTEFRMEAVALVAVVLSMVFGPLLVFVPLLAEARRRGLREYGTLAERYARAFDQKWLRGGAPPDEQLLGTGDIQSLADLGNSLEVIRSMRAVPITKEAVFQLGIVTFAPMLPLLLTAMPLEELVKRLFGLLFKRERGEACREGNQRQRHGNLGQQRRGCDFLRERSDIVGKEGYADERNKGRTRPRSKAPASIAAGARSDGSAGTAA